MKINVAYVYWFLHCTLVVSSCLLIILVSSEGASSTTTVLQEEINKINSTEERTNHNPENNQYNIDQEPKVVSSFQERQDEAEPISDIGRDFTQFEAASQNSGVASEIVDGEPDVVVTLVDSATLELKQRVEASHETIFQSSQIINQSEGNNVSEVVRVTEEKRREEPLPKHLEPAAENRSDTETEDSLVAKDVIPEPSTTNKTEDTVQPEDIPSFSEWAQKQLEEAEKKKEQVNTSTQNQNANGKPASFVKLRSKNYASPDCGAKIVAANPEAVSAGSVLSPSRDEYKLNACTSRIWFVVELCEAIQAKKIDLANFELFSSSPKDFSVSVSDRFPSREWSSVGHFTAKDERDVQSFELHPHLFGKYIKVELHSHHGSEHFCPISLFRAYGTSEFEVLEKEDREQSHSSVPEDDDDDDDDEIVGGDDSPKNLFGSARDAVMSIVKKAAEVLGNSGNASAEQRQLDNYSVSVTPLIKSCKTPSHLVVCDNCSDVLYGYVYELLSCHGRYLQRLLGIGLINKTLRQTDICARYGLTFARSDRNVRSYAFVNSFFDEKYLGALCNVLAVHENKVVLNVSDQYSNVTKAPPDSSDLFNISVSVPHIAQSEQTPELAAAAAASDSATAATSDLVTATVVTNSDVIVNESVASLINPTKTLREDEEAHQNVTHPSEGGVSLPGEITATADASASLTLAPSNVTSAYAAPERGADSARNDSAAAVTPPTQQETADVTETASSATDSAATDLDAGDSLDEQLNKLMSELGSADITSSSVTTTVLPPSSMPQAQKESIFVRLANRIKALERNMSLSSQYLEELSRRYKKQVEEMQRLLDKTLAKLGEENRAREERDVQVQEQLSTLTATINMLMVEKDSWSHTAGKFGQFLLLQVTVVFLFVYCCWKNPETKFSNAPPPAQKTTLTRRQSIDVIRHADVKKRRAGEEIRIVRTCGNDVYRLADCNNCRLVHPDEVDSSSLTKTSKAEKKRRKKKMSLQRSASITTLNQPAAEEHVTFTIGGGNGAPLTNAKKHRRASSVAMTATKPSPPTQSNHNRLSLASPEVLTLHNGVQDCPVALEESEHVSPEPLTYARRDKSPNEGGSAGSSSSGSKHVRVSSNPIYMKTALSTRYNRSVSCNSSAGGAGWNGDSPTRSAAEQQNGSNDASSTKSLVYSSHRRSPTPSTSVDSNSLDALNGNGFEIKKEKKHGSFKRILKKVFD